MFAHYATITIGLLQVFCTTIAHSDFTRRTYTQTNAYIHTYIHTYKHAHIRRYIHMCRKASTYPYIRMQYFSTCIHARFLSCSDRLEGVLKSRAQTSMSTRRRQGAHNTSSMPEITCFNAHSACVGLRKQTALSRNNDKRVVG